MNTPNTVMESRTLEVIASLNRAVMGAVYFYELTEDQLTLTIGEHLSDEVWLGLRRVVEERIPWARVKREGDKLVATY